MSRKRTPKSPAAEIPGSVSETEGNLATLAPPGSPVIPGNPIEVDSITEIEQRREHLKLNAREILNTALADQKILNSKLIRAATLLHQLGEEGMEEHMGIIPAGAEPLEPVTRKPIKQVAKAGKVVAGKETANQFLVRVVGSAKTMTTREIQAAWTSGGRVGKCDNALSILVKKGALARRKSADSKGSDYTVATGTAAKQVLAEIGTGAMSAPVSAKGKTSKVKPAAHTGSYTDMAFNAIVKLGGKNVAGPDILKEVRRKNGEDIGREKIDGALQFFRGKMVNGKQAKVGRVKVVGEARNYLYTALA
jgi:hypothetical protein